MSAVYIKLQNWILYLQIYLPSLFACKCRHRINTYSCSPMPRITRNHPRQGLTINRKTFKLNALQNQSKLNYSHSKDTQMLMLPSKTTNNRVSDCYLKQSETNNTFMIKLTALQLQDSLANTQVGDGTRWSRNVKCSDSNDKRKSIEGETDL